MTSKTEHSSRKLILIDGNGLAYRSFYAVPPQKTRAGLPTNAVLGFTNLLLNVLLNEKPTHVVVAFDQSATSERLQRFQGYNVQREEMPEELAAQIPMIEDLVRESGLAACRVPGHEADDCIGTLARRAREEGFQVLVVSGDLDLLQLVGPRVRVQTTRRGIGDLVVYDEEGVRRKYNLDPCQLADLRALAGDSSQNISGVPGIGEVTARKLLSQFRSLDDLLVSLDQLPAKWRNPLSENRHDAQEFRVRATIVTDLPLALDWERCRYQGIALGRLGDLLRRYEALKDFDPLLRRLGSGTAADAEAPSAPAILSADRARATLPGLVSASSDLAISWWRAEGVERGLAVASASQVVYVELGEGEGELSPAEAWRLVAPALEAPAGRCYVHRLRDVAGGQVGSRPAVLDVAVASALLDVGEREHTLEAIARRHDLATASEDEWSGLEPGQPVDCAERSCWTARRARTLLELGPLVRDRLHREGLEHVYRTVDLPLSAILGDLDGGRLNFDPEAVQDVNRALEHELEALRREIHAEADRPFNLDCDKELGEFLFDSLGLLVPTRPKNGGSIGAEVLVSLVGQHPIALTVRNYRELSEFKACFVDGFLSPGRATAPVGGCLFNPSLLVENRLQWLGPVTCGGVVETWHRMLAVIDNLQCVSLRARLKALVERTLVPSAPGRCLLALEYDQLELRLLAYLAGDVELGRRLEDEDVEASLVSILFGTLNSQDTLENRWVAVQVALHGMGPRWLARRLDLSEDRAADRLQAFRTDFGARFPQTEDWFQARFEQARRLEPQITVAGRRRTLPEVRSRNHDIREAAERYARAAAVEGSVADLLRATTVALAEVPQVTLAMPVFNRVILDVPGSEVEAVRRAAEGSLAALSMGARLPWRWHLGQNGAEVCSTLKQPACPVC